jgi:ectoine hydroxylase-related dioxygenase (phytanoyl-CoA dioxygenase family)
VSETLPSLEGEYTLPDDQVASYRREGHLLLRGVASPEEVAAYRPAVLRVIESVVREHDSQGRLDDYASLFTQVTNAWRLDETVRRFVFAPRFAHIAARLMEGVRGVRLYHDQALVKEPGGRPTPWHQDHYYWPLDTEHALTMWMPLVDVSEEMGPMAFASGSHRIGPLGELPISGATGDRLARLIEEKGFPIASRPLGAGDATFHSSRMLHSASANRSGRRREVMTVIYFADGTRLLEPDNPHRRVDMEVFVPGVRPGEPAASPLNPLLWSQPA